VKANPAPEIIRTLYRVGASFDVASLTEFMPVCEHIKHLRACPTPARRSSSPPSSAAPRCEAVDLIALNISAAVIAEARARGREIKILDIGGGFPARYNRHVQPFSALARIIGKALRDGKTCYYIDDSVYHTFSGIIFDHCQYHLKAFKKGPTEICTVFGQTCDGMDTISPSEELPELEIEDLLHSENIGAYSSASATFFNGFPPAKAVHVNE